MLLPLEISIVPNTFGCVATAGGIDYQLRYLPRGWTLAYHRSDLAPRFYPALSSPRLLVTVDLMPYNILHVKPYMQASAGGPRLWWRTSSPKLGHSSEVVSTLAFCNDGDERNLRKRLWAICSYDVLTGLETVSVVSRRGAEKINAHVRRADIVHVHRLWGPLNVAARYACRKHDRPDMLKFHNRLASNGKCL